MMRFESKDCCVFLFCSEVVSSKEEAVCCRRRHELVVIPRKAFGNSLRGGSERKANFAKFGANQERGKEEVAGEVRGRDVCICVPFLFFFFFF